MPLWLEPFVVMTTAAVLSGVIGLDRELRGKPAGLRTHMLVGVGAAAFTYLSANVFPGVSGIADPGRVAAQVVSGIGFLGAGAIFAARGKPHGLTTAAALWASAAVGVCVGASEYVVALAVVGVAAAVLWPMDAMIVRWLRRAARSHELHLLVDDLETLAQVRHLLASEGFEPRDVNVTELGGRFQVTLSAHGPQQRLPELLVTLDKEQTIMFVSTGSVDTAFDERA